MKKRTMATSLAAHSPKLIRSVERRLFLRQGLSVGALAMLSGCNLTDDESVQQVLAGMSRWNDRAQGWIFSPTRLAPEFPESAITKPENTRTMRQRMIVRYAARCAALYIDRSSWASLPRSAALISR